jgi:hypothetical protein
MKCCYFRLSAVAIQYGKKEIARGTSRTYVVDSLLATSSACSIDCLIKFSFRLKEARSIAAENALKSGKKVLYRHHPGDGMLLKLIIVCF